MQASKARNTQTPKHWITKIETQKKRHTHQNTESRKFPEAHPRILHSRQFTGISNGAECMVEYLNTRVLFELNTFALLEPLCCWRESLFLVEGSAFALLKGIPFIWLKGVPLCCWSEYLSFGWRECLCVAEGLCVIRIFVLLNIMPFFWLDGVLLYCCWAYLCVIWTEYLHVIWKKYLCVILTEYLCDVWTDCLWVVWTECSCLLLTERSTFTLLEQNTFV